MYNIMAVAPYVFGYTEPRKCSAFSFYRYGSFNTVAWVCSADLGEYFSAGNPLLIDNLVLD
jgi:hypothetical protein